MSTKPTLLVNKPSIINFGKYHFMVMDSPTDTNLQLYIEEFHKHNVKTVVRVCEPTYDTKPLKDENIEIYEWPFKDGESPPSDIISDWLDLVDSKFADNKASQREEDAETIAIHCVAGLGRAPVLVAIALVESGMEPLDAIDYVRESRRGAINQKQIKFLTTEYKKRKKGICNIL